jgi:hypothetical protein
MGATGIFGARWQGSNREGAAMSDKKPGKPGTDPTPPDNEDDRAAGTIDNPVSPGEVQPGEMGEAAAARGGPVDITPTRKHPLRDE